MGDLRYFHLFIALAACLLGCRATSAQSFVNNSRLVLGSESSRSASIRIGDLDGDNDLDLVVANGRHWPGQNLIYLNQGNARFNVVRPLGVDRSTSYACELADLDGDGDLDIAVGNDMAACQIFLNDGQASFQRSTRFGVKSSVRSLKVIDLDQDGDQDILITCRGRANLICLNDGKATFDKEIEFGSKTDSTIDVDVGDVNGDGHLDLLLANRAEKSCWLLNDGKLNFDRSLPFGEQGVQSRGVAVGDFNSDGKLDWAVGNIGSENRVFLGNGEGGYESEVRFGAKEGRTYSLAAADIDTDGDLDLVTGNAGQGNSVFFNIDRANVFREEVFDRQMEATYGVCVGDINGDGKPDVVVANSESVNRIFINRRNVAAAQASESDKKQRSAAAGSNSTKQKMLAKRRPEDSNKDWPAFRGAGGRGIADGFELPQKWNADSKEGALQNVLWQVDVPGLGHSSPVVVGQRLYLLTAVSKDKKAPLKVQSGGRPTAADDNGLQDWLLLCYDKTSGKEVWRKVLRQGKPRATRHAKATHANTSVCVSGDKVVSFLGSEGLYCHDLDGNEIWKQDLGVINISKYGIGWGFSSSPTIFKDRILLVCDDPENPFLSARRLSDGGEIWRVARKGICERSWGTPLVHSGAGVTQVVVNGWPWIASYELESGKEIWRLKGGGDNPVPSPFVSEGLIYVTNAHGGPSPIYAIRPSARGELKLDDKDSFAWNVQKGGSYMSTPVVYQGQIYLGDSRGVLRTFDAKSGEKLGERRLGRNAGVISSLVAGDGKVYVASENGTVYVVELGSDLKVIAENQMGDPCLATPAISEGVIYLRTTSGLTAVK